MAGRQEAQRRPAPPRPSGGKPGPSVGPVAWILVVLLGFLLLRGLFEDVGARRVAYSALKEELQRRLEAKGVYDTAAGYALCKNEFLI